MHDQKIPGPDINISLATNLIAEQFPQWAHLPISPVRLNGWDNRTFHLGDQLSIRLPSAERYAAKVLIEQRWLPVLAPHLSRPIPKPVALGQPSGTYPWHWSVYRWIDGENADTLPDDALPQFSVDIAKFLHELYRIKTAGGPPAGPHNFYRGASPAVYDVETKAALFKLKGVVDTESAAKVWEAAKRSEWNKDPVWIHGDFSAGNILVRDGKLAAVIDFGGMCVGDPACDLVIAWTFLSRENRKIFKENIGLDHDTWARARGWGLWKALITLAPLTDMNSTEAGKQKRIIDAILID